MSSADTSMTYSPGAAFDDAVLAGAVLAGAGFGAGGGTGFVPVELAKL
jgi:hypothetical protein